MNFDRLKLLASPIIVAGICLNVAAQETSLQMSESRSVLSAPLSAPTHRLTKEAGYERREVGNRVFFSSPNGMGPTWILVCTDACALEGGNDEHDHPAFLAALAEMEQRFATAQPMQANEVTKVADATVANASAQAKPKFPPIEVLMSLRPGEVW